MGDVGKAATYDAPAGKPTGEKKLSEAVKRVRSVEKIEDDKDLEAMFGFTSSAKGPDAEEKSEPKPAKKEEEGEAKAVEC